MGWSWCWGVGREERLIRDEKKGWDEGKHQVKDGEGMEMAGGTGVRDEMGRR